MTCTLLPLALCLNYRFKHIFLVNHFITTAAAASIPFEQYDLRFHDLLNSLWFLEVKQKICLRGRPVKQKQLSMLLLLIDTLLHLTDWIEVLRGVLLSPCD